MNQANALKVIREKASKRYNSAKAEALLKFLANKVSIFRTGKRDTKMDIENRWQELKLFTVLDGITVDESYFYRLMEKVQDIVEFEVKNRKMRYRLNLEALRQFQVPSTAKRDAERYKAKLSKMREQYAANREREKREELLQFLRQYNMMSVEELISMLEAQNSTKGDNGQQ